MIDWNKPIRPPFDECPICNSEALHQPPHFESNRMNCRNCGWNGPMDYSINSDELEGRFKR